jgi:hypothetical protein
VVATARCKGDTSNGAGLTSPSERSKCCLNTNHPVSLLSTLAWMMTQMYKIVWGPHLAMQMLWIVHTRRVDGC